MAISLENSTSIHQTQAAFVSDSTASMYNLLLLMYTLVSICTLRSYSIEHFCMSKVQTSSAAAEWWLLEASFLSKLNKFNNCASIYTHEIRSNARKNDEFTREYIHFEPKKDCVSSEAQWAFGMGHESCVCVCSRANLPSMQSAYYFNIERSTHICIQAPKNHVSLAHPATHTPVETICFHLIT